MTVKCAWGDNCEGTPKWQVELRLWALSMDITARTHSNCIKMLSSVVVCEECRPRMKAQDFLVPEAKERIATVVNRAGRDVPDFERAALHFVEIIDEPLDVMALIPPGAEVIEG